MEETELSKMKEESKSNRCGGESFSNNGKALKTSKESGTLH